MQKSKNLVATILLLAFMGTACVPIQPEAAAPAAESTVVHLTLLHFNDLYEITPVGGGALGGAARVTTVRKELLAENPNTFTFFAGDAYSPSGLGLAVVDGTPIDGEQAVAALNAMGVDYMTFGDHEFHVSSEEEFYQRLEETEFPILSSNIFDANGDSFPGVTTSAIFTVTNEAGAALQVGVFGLTEDLGETPVAHTYVDPMEAAQEQVDVLQEDAEILIGLTHFRVTEDVEIAKMFPEIDLILGGDDHENMAVEAGPDLATIYKADSNVRSVQIIDLFYDTATDELTVEARLQPITDAIPDDPETLAVVNHWVEVAFDAFRQEGTDPAEVVAQAPVDLDGFASSIRNHPTDFTHILADGILHAVSDADLAFYISGIVRLDDLIPAGSDVTEYDMIRGLPYDPGIVSIEIPGGVLKTVLDSGQEFAGSGGYILTTENVSLNEAGDGWLIDGEPLDPERTYVAAVLDFTYDELQADVQLVEQSSNTLRQALIDELQSR